MRRPMLTWGGFLLLFSLAFLSAPCILFPADVERRPSALINSPVPYYHTYNLTSMFPLRPPSLAQAEGAGAGAKAVLTLDECITRALERNPGYGKVQESLRAAASDIVNAWGNFMPNMSASYGLSQGNFTQAYVDAAGNLRFSGGISKSSSGNISLNFTLFDRATHYFEMKNARYLRDQRRSDLRNSELDLVDQVRRAYFNTLRQQKLLLSGENLAGQRREQLKLAEARFSVGSVTKLDVLQAQIDLKKQEMNIVLYQNNLKTAKMELIRLMSGNLVDDFDLADEFTVREVNFDVNALVTEAEKNHPQLKSLNFQIKQSEGNLWMGRLSYLPSLRTNTSYQRTEDGLHLTPRRNKGRNIGFSMYWNILDGFDRFKQNRYAEMNLNNLHYDFAAQQLVVEKAVRDSYNELIRIYRNSQTLSENKELASQSLNLLQERYRLGSANILELRQAQVDFADAEVQYINSIYDFHSAISTLSHSVGRDLSQP